MTGVEQSPLLRPFATAILAKATALRNLTLAPRHRCRLLESISDDIKKASNFIPHKMSKRAREAAAVLTPPVDLREMTWHEQHRFDPGRARFIVEHQNTVSSLREQVLTATTVEAVLDVLERNLVVVWILREEDAELTRLKYRVKRPPTAYLQAGIEVWTDEP